MLSCGFGFLSFSAFTGTYCVLGSTTTIVAGISAIGCPFSLATTVTGFSPGVVVSTGVLSLYSNVVPVGKSFGLMFSFGSGCFLAGSTGTYFG